MSRSFLIYVVASITLTGGSMHLQASDAKTQTVDAQTYLEVVDALHRFTIGMDTDDGALIASAFTRDGVADFAPAATKIGMQFPVLKGNEAIVNALVPFAANYITSHSVSNARVEMQGKRAKLYALVEAQHLPTTDPTKFFMMKNQYWMALKRESGYWRIQSMVIENLWTDGDLSVMTGE